MSKKIATYEDLLEEKARLQELLGLQKAAIKGSLSGLQAEVRPLTNGVLTVTRVLTRIGRRRRPEPTLLEAGVGFGIDVVLRRYLLRKAGWLTRTFVPLIAGRLAARFLAPDNDSVIARKVKEFMARFGMMQEEEAAA